MYLPLAIGFPGTTETILIVVAVLVLFGAKKIPELMRGFGEGIRELKKGAKEIEEMDNDNLIP